MKFKEINYRHANLPDKACSNKSDIPKRRYKPLSFYVLGGVDVDGSSLDKLRTDTPIAYDSDASISELESVGKIESIGVCDPRVDMMDIVAKTNSVSKAQAIVDGAVVAPSVSE